MDPLRCYDYLLASRDHVFGWLSGLPDDLYRSVHPIGLGSIARTMHHLRGAEWAYMHRIRGVTGLTPKPTPEVDPDCDHGDALAFSQLEPAWREQGIRVRADLESVSDWSTPMVCETLWEGKPYFYRASRSDFFAQLVIHEAHHRAQVMHMLKRLGIDTGEIDYNTLMWERVEPDT
jgi:uncharacterized damage-inducible protein DinB